MDKWEKLEQYIRELQGGISREGYDGEIEEDLLDKIQDKMDDLKRREFPISLEELLNKSYLRVLGTEEASKGTWVRYSTMKMLLNNILLSIKTTNLEELSRYLKHQGALK